MSSRRMSYWMMRALKNEPEQTKETIKETLLKHHIEHSTIEIESRYHCAGMVCEERDTNNNK